MTCDSAITNAPKRFPFGARKRGQGIKILIPNCSPLSAFYLYRGCEAQSIKVALDVQKQGSVALSATFRSVGLHTPIESSHLKVLAYFQVESIPLIRFRHASDVPQLQRAHPKAFLFLDPQDWATDQDLGHPVIGFRHRYRIHIDL